MYIAKYINAKTFDPWMYLSIDWINHDYLFVAINDTLEVLDLSWNHIRRMGALAICKGLQVFNRILQNCY
jgi:hypothetical protein